VVPPHLIVAALVQGRAPVWSREEVVTAVVVMTTGLATAVLVHVVVRRIPWPRPFRLRFAATQLAAAAAVVMAWLAMSSALLALFVGRPFLAHVNQNAGMFLFFGTIVYAVVAGITYAVEATARAARAEAVAARTQLAALRAQVHPHFLFNALHTVVQLIPVEPQRAADAAELVAGLLRTTLEEQRDEVTLEEEWRFVSRYLAVERIRFGDRLAVRAELAEGLLDARVPAFALQTLVENAVQHGAAPRVAATEIVVTAAGSASELTLSVRNTGDGAPVGATRPGSGTGLGRLRERLAVLYGNDARLACRPDADGGYEAVLVVPRRRRRTA
jgi:LytS/YehU family sensor histidine kinase